MPRLGFLPILLSCFQQRSITIRLKSLPRSKHHFPLTSAYIEWIHDKLLSVEWPGIMAGVCAHDCNRQLLESAAARPFQTAFGRYIHRGVIRRGAALFHSLIANHPFGDGNKRTAVTALHHFLLANGLLLIAKREDMYDLALRTASSGGLGITQDTLLKELTDYLKSRTVPISKLNENPVLTTLYEKMATLKHHIRTNRLNRS
ncbi:MAG: type II toxin-antitoxin system death-on-curing family toxin [Terriglobia bacterium]